MTVCMYAAGTTGSNKNRCRDRAAPGSVLCATHRSEALERVRRGYNAQQALIKGLRWSGLTWQAGRRWV